MGAKMKILHIWNTAGIGSIIAKHMDRLYGTESLVVMRHSFDPFGFTTYGKLWNCGSKMFGFKSLLLARRFDIIHVHYFDAIIPFLKFFHHEKPAIIHYHGDDIRNKWVSRRRYWSKADLALYSTPDLLNIETPKDAVYIPNPVDTDLFYPLNRHDRKPKSAMCFPYHVDEEKAKCYARRYGLDLTFIQRKVSYREMPRLLNQYEYYIDQTEIPSLSKTALEALACGLKVITVNGYIVEDLPPQHRPENVAKQIYEIYLNLLRNSSHIETSFQ
ncbi:MAG: hypothetical protein ACUVV4_07920 [Candidatus Bathyarchaeia archaeon]